MARARKDADFEGEAPPNMADDQTMPGFEGDGEDAAPPPEDGDFHGGAHPGTLIEGRFPGEYAEAEGGEGEQGSYLPPDVPEGYIRPPSATQFANATWLPAGPEVRALVEECLGWDEFSELAPLDYAVVWRRATKPTRFLPDGEPDAILASVEIVKPRILWQVERMELLHFPRYFVDVHWRHFDDLRKGEEGEGAQYIHGQILQRHIHHALMTLGVDADAVVKRAPDFQGYAKTVERFGVWGGGLYRMQRAFRLWDRGEDEPEPGE